MKTAEKLQNKQELESLKNEVLETLKREDLKKQIVSDLQIDKQKRTIGKVMQHPAILALIVLLTNVCTAYVTASWQRNDWQEQQVRLAQLRLAEQKRAVVDDVAKTFAGINAVDDDVLDIYYNDVNSEKLNKEEVNRRTNWGEEVKNWEINSQRFQQKIALYFKDPKIKALFEEVIARTAKIHHNLGALPYDSNERYIGRLVKDLIKENEKEKSKNIFVGDEVIANNINEAMEEREKLKESINQIVRLMRAEIEAEELGKQSGFEAGNSQAKIVILQ